MSGEPHEPESNDPFELCSLGGVTAHSARFVAAPLPLGSGMGRVRVTAWQPDAPNDVLSSAWQDLDSFGRVQVEVVGLAPNTTYRYRWESEDGTHVGRQRLIRTFPEASADTFSFEWPPPLDESVRLSEKIAEHLKENDNAFIVDGDYHYPFDPKAWSRPPLWRRIWSRFKLRVVYPAKHRIGYYRLKRRAYWKLRERGTLWGRPYWWLKRKGWIKSRPIDWRGFGASGLGNYSDHDYGDERYEGKEAGGP